MNANEQCNNCEERIVINTVLCLVKMDEEILDLIEEETNRDFEINIDFLISQFKYEGTWLI